MNLGATATSVPDVGRPAAPTERQRPEDQRILLNLLARTMPVSTNQRAEASSASTAGRGAYPSSSRARLLSKDIREVDMRAASSGTDGCRRKSFPSTSSETAATPRASELGTLP